MSVYRKFHSLPANDVYAYGKVWEKPAPTPAPKNLALEKENRRLRRATPANEPLPHTLKWVASLPLNVRPVALLRHYARIANIIAATWRDPASFVPYTDSLFIDKRASRQGFPPDVLSELLALRRYYDTLRADDLSAGDFVGKVR